MMPLSPPRRPLRAILTDLAWAALAGLVLDAIIVLTLFGVGP